MICARFVDPGNGQPPVLTLAPSQPADLSTCDAVVLTGADSGALSLFQMPTSADAATVWWYGFSLVVGSYAIGWAVGAVVNFINGK